MRGPLPRKIRAWNVWACLPLITITGKGTFVFVVSCYVRTYDGLTAIAKCAVYMWCIYNVCVTEKMKPRVL